MGCGSSREAVPADDRRTSPSTSQARDVTNITIPSQPAIAQNRLSQSSNHENSPATSRVALNPVSTTSLQSGSALSSPRPSSNRLHHHRGAADAAASELSEHYNLPLQNPRPWKSQSRAWTPSQLRRERQDFFDTRVTGQTEVWEALRQVSECIREGDLPTAQGIVDAVNVTLPTGYMEDGCYDERGCLYRIPEEVLTDPTNLQSDDREVDGETVVEVPAEAKAKLSNDTLDKQLASLPTTILEREEPTAVEKGKGVIPENAIQLKCRMSDRGSDISTFTSKSEPVSQLAARLRVLGKTPRYTRIEIFYLGKKLDQKRRLDEQDYVEGHVLNIFVVGAPK